MGRKATLDLAKFLNGCKKVNKRSLVESKLVERLPKITQLVDSSRRRITSPVAIVYSTALAKALHSPIGCLCDACCYTECQDKIGDAGWETFELD